MTLDNFWARMSALFGHSWTAQYGEQPDGLAGDTWSAALAGLRPLQIAKGLHATLMLGGEFPPTAPHFRALCYDIPTFADVRREMAHRADPMTAFCLLCWQCVDVYRLQRAEQHEADRLIREAYETARAHVMVGGELPTVRAELHAPKPPVHVPASEATAAKALQDVADALGVDVSSLSRVPS